MQTETSHVIPPADDAYYAKNPTGKYPCLEFDDGTFLSETKVILNYLEDAYPEVPLLPKNSRDRARVRELMEVIDLYLELPARRLYPEVFSGEGAVSDTEEENNPALDLDGQVTVYERKSGEEIDAVKQLLELEPDNMEMQHWLGFLLYSNNRYEEAMVKYNSSVV